LKGAWSGKVLPGDEDLQKENAAKGGRPGEG